MRWFHNETRIRRLLEFSAYPWFYKIFSTKCYGAVQVLRNAFFIGLKRDENKIVVKLTTTKLHKQKKSRVT